ncbi:MAG: peptidase S41, partial [Rikenellaceae bacterium]|nr:peptidase S41 [Rikenellaceae bacterium]
IKVIDKDLRGRFYPAPDGESFFVLGSKGVKKIEAKSGSSKNVDFRGEYEYFPDKEREYIFEHCWTQVREKFYVEDMHGVDWEAVGENYRQFLPYITDNYAFQELLSEMLGELNGSHTGGRYYDGTGVSIGYVGVLFDPAFDGPGLKIAEFLPGSVLLTSAPSLKEGDIIMSIDAKPIPAGQPWYKAFERKAGKRVLLTIKSGKDEVKLYITPSSSDSQALYTRWVRRNEQKVKELSGGRIGYVHVKGMNSPSFREVYSKALGKYRGCDALIVDTRHNGGGWLHNDLAVFLNARLYTERRPRGVEMSPEPYDKWIKPSCVLVCEDNYSDACGFPYLYRSLGIGKIIGAPVAGTATSVWWERQVDPTLIFGVPQVGSWSVSEGRFLENHQLEPDIVVYNDPASVMAGEDKQLEAAVAEMLKASAK